MGNTMGRCNRPSCTAYATHLLVDRRGDSIRSCSEHWRALVMAVESLGGRVAECPCRECMRGDALLGVRVAGTAGGGGRPEAVPPVAGRTRGRQVAGNLRAPV